jgi:hypothetical protein
VIRRLEVVWPDARPFRERGGRPLRLLATSDEFDPALEERENRESLGSIDLVVGCGDLSPDRLCFIADAFHAPLVYVRGNHDRGDRWPDLGALPAPSGGLDRRSLQGLPLLALPWPGRAIGAARRDEPAAWRQALRPTAAAIVRRTGPCLVFSHVPPRDLGDTPSDPYHRGFGAYRFVLDRLAPPLWLHGHTAMAASADWRVQRGPCTVVNVTGAVLVELVPPPEAGSAADGATADR